MKIMLENKNILLILSLLFCLSGSAADYNTMGKDVNLIDTIGFSIHENVDNYEMVVVLKDTSYTFPISKIESISVKENVLLENNKCNFFDLGLNASGQSGIIINDTVIIFNTGGAATATAMLTNEKTTFNPECIDYHPHCNVANYYYKNGRHYVYLSEWDGQHRCFVEELYYDKNKGWKSKLVQIISMDIDDSIRGTNNMDWIVDSENEMIYTQTYKDGSSENATGLIYMQFKLPSLENNREVTIREDQIIRRTEFPMIYITQDKFIYRGKIYVASGWGGNRPGMVTVIDLADFHIDDIYDLSYRDAEPEMIDIYKDNLLVFYWRNNNYSVQNKKSVYIHFKDGMCFSYPTSNITQIILQ